MKAQVVEQADSEGRYWDLYLVRGRQKPKLIGTYDSRQMAAVWGALAAFEIEGHPQLDGDGDPEALLIKTWHVTKLRQWANQITRGFGGWW